MKATIYTALALIVGGAIAYMLYAQDEIKPTNSYASDDELLYQKLREDLKSYLITKGTFYGGWLDDEVNASYANGAISKTEAFVNAATLHYPEKGRYYKTLLQNLKKRYQ